MVQKLRAKSAPKNLTFMSNPGYFWILTVFLLTYGGLKAFTLWPKII